MVSLRKLLPDQPIQYLCSSLPDDLPERVKKYRFDIDVEYHALTKESVEALHRDGIGINCWTVDDPVRDTELASWGVDYMTSDILEAEA